MEKKIACLFLAAWLLTLVVGASAASALELKISHVLPANETVHEILLEMGKDLEQKSNGFFKVSVYANSELGNNKDNIEQIRRGANIIAIADCGFLADYVPAYGAMNGPFLYKNWREIVELGKSPWHEKMKAECAAKGMKILGMDWYFGRRHVISGKAIRTPADMANMKVRVPPNKVWIDTITAMGGSPTVLQWSEVYSALSQGVVDAAEAPLSTIFGSKLFEVKKNISLTGHFTALTGTIMSQKLFDSMPKEYQEMLQKAIDEWGIVCSERTEARENEWRKKLEEAGVIFNEVDAAAFADACQKVFENPAWPKYRELRDNIEK